MELAELFRKSKGAPIVVDGEKIYAIIQKKSKGINSILIRRKSARKAPTPGIRIQGSNIQFAVNNQTLNDIILWADTSPAVVTINVVSGRQEGIIKIWNCWRDSQGITQAWLRNAAMKVEEKADFIEVFCNSGPSELDFKDLLIDIYFELIEKGP